MSTLRDYQEQAVSQVLQSLQQNPLLVSPPGSGKTRMGVSLANQLGCRCLWIAHRRELIDQAAETLRRDGADVGVIQAGRPSLPSRRSRLPASRRWQRSGSPLRQPTW